jgi:predicted porin
MTRFSRHLSGAPLSLAFAAAAAALPCGAFAQSNVTLYGLVDGSVGQFQNAGQPKIKKQQSGNMTTSFIAFKGSEDLGGGLKAMFNLESFIGADSGQVLGRTPTTFWDRQSNVGLGGSFGSIFLGNNTTDLFIQGLSYNPFASSMAFSPTMRHMFSAYGTAGGGATSWLNSVQYFSPTIGGLNFGLQGAAGEGTGKSSWAGSASYSGGPLSVGAVYQRYRYGASPTDRATWDVGGTYDFGPVKLYAQYGKTEEKLTATQFDAKFYQVGAKVPIGAGAILASYGQDKYDSQSIGAGTDYTNKLFSAGYDYFLSKRTDLYAVYMLDKTTNLSNGNTFVAGMRHRF